VFEQKALSGRYNDGVTMTLPEGVHSR